MRKSLLILTALLLFSSLPCGARKLPGEALGTVTYEIRYKWGVIDAKVATATFTLEPSEWEKKDAYHFGTVITTSSIFKLFINSDIHADSYIAQSDLLPLYFLNPTPRGKVELTYDRDTKKVEAVIRDTKRGDADKTYPLDKRTFDLLSLLSYVRFRDNSSKSETVTLIMGDVSHPATLRFEGKDTDKFPGIEAERFHLSMTGRGLMENGSGKELTFWRSPDSGHKILGLEADLGNGFMSIRIKQ